MKNSCKHLHTLLKGSFLTWSDHVLQLLKKKKNNSDENSSSQLNNRKKLSLAKEDK
jgi:hypothetical protein